MHLNVEGTSRLRLGFSDFASFPRWASHSFSSMPLELSWEMCPHQRWSLISLTATTPLAPVWRCDDKQKNLDKDTTPSWNVALVPYLKKSNGARCLFLKNNSWSSPLVTPVPFLLLTPNHNNGEQKHAFRKSLSSAVIIRPDMPGVSFTRKGSYVSKYGP